MTTEHQPNQDTMPEQTAAEADAANNNAPSGEPLSDEQALQAANDRIAALEAELAEMKERWMRAEAENANVRTRARKDVDDTRQYAVQNLKRGIDSLPPPSDDQPAIVAKVREGLEGVERSFISTLERNGIKQDDPVGQKFDPNLHQAMAEQESEQHAPGTIIQAWSKAWTLNGRLLRPAMVVVAKAPVAELAGPGTG
jgi:molecular chaperone GrpE